MCYSTEEEEASSAKNTGEEDEEEEETLKGPAETEERKDMMIITSRSGRLTLYNNFPQNAVKIYDIMLNRSV